MLLMQRAIKLKQILMTSQKVTRHSHAIACLSKTLFPTVDLFMSDGFEWYRGRN
jgi:hypothetical protein